MPLLIDCYNVLHAEKPMALAGLGEASLCALLAVSGWARDGVAVVSDGSPKPNSPDPHGVEPVELIFSGPGRTADDVIIDRINKDTSPRRLTVVSNDREIQKAARRRRARVWTAEEFLNRMERMARGRGSAANPAGPDKTDVGPLADEQIDRWLAWFGVPKDTAEPGDNTPDDDGPADPWDFDPDEIDRMMGG